MSVGPSAQGEAGMAAKRGGDLFNLFGDLPHLLPPPPYILPYTRGV